MRVIFAAVTLIVLPALARAADPVHVEKTKVESLASIPQEAELVCLSARSGVRSEFGLPALEIYVADANGDYLTQITRQRKIYNHVAVSPDRNKIAAGRYDHGDTNKDGRINSKDRKTLVVLDLEAKQEWPLLPEADDACLGGVDWTPDGQYIVASMRRNGAVDIYRVHPDGSGLENLTAKLDPLLGAAQKPLFVSDVGVSFDGRWLAFLCVVQQADMCRIVRMRMDGSEAHFVTDGGGPGAVNRGNLWGSGDFDPEFSPDGQYICFQRTTPHRTAFGGVASSDVMRIKIDGTDLLRLSPEGNKAVHGISKWSQDNHIVFSEWDADASWSGVVLVNPDGTNYHRVEKLKGYTWVRWIPPRSP